MKTLLGAIVSFSCVSLVRARVNGQFKHFYLDYRQDLNRIFATNCSQEFNEIQADPSVGGFWVVKCALQYLDDMNKAEMAACSVILGLLPAALQFIGPKLSDISILALQRPALSLLITLGSPCATFEHERTGLEPTRKDHDEPLWPKLLTKPAFWVKALISLIEYCLVGLAAANSLVQAYQLTFWAVTLVSTTTGTFGGNPEAFSPLVWVVLTLPIHVLGVCARHLRQNLSREAKMTVDTNPQEPFSVSRAARSAKNWIVQEFTPCAYQRYAALPSEVRPSYRLLFLNWAIRLGVWVQFIMGIVVLSSILFVSLWQTLQIVGRFFAGSILCRLVLEFELYGSREISRLD